MAEAPDPNDQGDQGDEMEEKVAVETEQILKSFMYRRLTSQYEEAASQGNLEVAPITRNLLNELRPSDQKAKDDQKKYTDELGQTLAEVGDQIQLKYRDTFREMVLILNLTPNTAYDSFASVARKLFNNGINWGRIIALLYFGYEIAVTVIRRGLGSISSFLRKIVQFVVKFIVKERIARWIADNGGWKALLDFRKNNENVWFMRLCVLALLGGFIIIAHRVFK